MDQLPALPPGDYTLYEIAGLRGLSWWTIPLNVDGTRNCNLWNYVWSQAGNLIFTVSKTALQVTISIKEAAAADDPLKFLYDESGGAVSTVFAVFFVPIAILDVHPRRHLGGHQRVAPQRHPGRSRRGRGRRRHHRAGRIRLHRDRRRHQRVPQPSRERSTPRSPRSTPSPPTPCSTTSPRTAGPAPCPTGRPARSAGNGITSCVLADALAYRPWAIGQFGGAGAGPIPLPGDWTVVTPGADGAIPIEALREEKALPCYVAAVGDCQDLRTYLIAQHGGVQIGDTLSGQNGYLKCAASATQAFTDSPAWMLIKTAAEESGESTAPLVLALSSACSPMYRVFRALSESNVTTAQAYAGDVGIARVTQAFSSLIGTAVTAVPVLITGIITMAWIALTFALYITGPVQAGLRDLHRQSENGQGMGRRPGARLGIPTGLRNPAVPDDPDHRLDARLHHVVRAPPGLAGSHPVLLLETRAEGAGTDPPRRRIDRTRTWPATFNAAPPAARRLSPAPRPAPRSAPGPVSSPRGSAAG